MLAMWTIIAAASTCTAAVNTFVGTGTMLMFSEWAVVTGAVTAAPAINAMLFIVVVLVFLERAIAAKAVARRITKPTLCGHATFLFQSMILLSISCARKVGES